MSLELCIHKKEAESQRKDELERYGHDDNCKGYKVAGCYCCDGMKKDCFYYQLPKKG